MAAGDIGRIGLGTVQWGLAYGVANRTGRPARAEVAHMLSRARHAGVSLLDTAVAYGEAEAVIGGVSEAQAFEVVTKTLPYRPQDEGPERPEAVMAGIRASLARLNRTRVHALLVHHADELLASHGADLWARLTELKGDGSAGRLGVSVYDPEQLDRLLDRFAIEIVQLPFNAVDQRFARSGMLARLKRAGIEVHVRSAFLQGVLLMQPADLPAHLAGLRAPLAAWREAIAAVGLRPVEAALGFCLQHDEVGRVILGCDNEAQLDQLLGATNAVRATPADVAGFAVEDGRLIDPRQWPAVQ